MYYTGNKSKLHVNNAVQGKSIEEKMREILNNGEPIEDSSPMIYTERAEGVQPQYDIRTDRFDIALEAMDKVNRSNIAKAAEKPLEAKEKKEEITFVTE